ncbi:MAG: DUF2341 domain-containing protein [Candidatus Aenigmatarchaeota archaeon]
MKAQLSWEFVATVFLFIISTVYFLFVIFQLSPYVKYGIEAETKRAKAFKISEILISDPGEPADWSKEYFGPSLKTYRLPINFSGYTSIIPNYSLLISINTQQLISSNKSDGNCNSIRFTDDSFNSLFYYLESGCNSQNTRIWIKTNLPLNRNGTIYMYYYNSTIESLSDAKKVFDLFDDFSNSSYTSGRWYFENK